MKLWHLGNTTVRSPFRLRDGLVALSASPLQHNLRGREQELALRDLLGAQGIVALGKDATYSVGRKWRSALGKLGFLYPEVGKKLAGVTQAQVGPVDAITPNGWRLIRADSVPAMQECFLRALAAHYIPSPQETGFPFQRFSPLRHTLSVMLELERRTGDSRLGFLDMALVVQLSNASDGAALVAERVLDLRALRDAAPHKRKFDQQTLREAGERHGYEASTFNDYADTNFRYLKATGLVQGKGRGIALTPEKHVFIEQLAAQTQAPKSDLDYFTALCEGASLPTDDKAAALLVLRDLRKQLRQRRIPFTLAGRPTATPADIAVVRHQIEDLLAQANETAYASRQAGQWEEIAAYMALLISEKKSARAAAPSSQGALFDPGRLSGGGAKTPDDDGNSGDNGITIPKAEAPAYFEWILWRAFLAIGGLLNPPYEARRFKIDQDFLPVGTAPGNGPDLVFEFEAFVLAVEVTLTANSRQEAAEGEPVRRHVADLAMRHDKPVYGLFLANKIDSNTAETFRIGVWYTSTDDRLRLDIVPLTLAQFKDLFEALFATSRANASRIHALLDQCGALRTQHEAPAWKAAIADTVRDTVARITAH